jgi:CRP/FNR family transcriptional regulator
VTALAIPQLADKQNRDESALARGESVADASGIANAVSSADAGQLRVARPGNDGKAYDPDTTWEVTLAPLASSTQVIPARRTICHPKEWSDGIPVICQGWAASSITLLDGRRQILAFLLPGDLVSTAYLLEPMSGRTVEAVTDVTCRKFSRGELKSFLFKQPALLEKLSKAWVEERTQADQLALDLGRRTADERIARLILNLAERLAKRGLVNGQSMEFPLRQRHVADATGLTPVHVSKVLSEFQRAGLLVINRRTLTIMNETDLRRVADWR